MIKERMCAHGISRYIALSSGREIMFNYGYDGKEKFFDEELFFQAVYSYLIQKGEDMIKSFNEISNHVFTKEEVKEIYTCLYNAALKQIEDDNVNAWWNRRKRHMEEKKICYCCGKNHSESATIK